MFLLILLLFILFGTMESTKIALHDLVLIGGGHSHVHVIKMFGMDPIEGVRMTVISKDVESPYSGMIPGYIAGYYTKEECHLDIGKLCSFARARHIVAEVQRVDTINKKIYCEDGRPPISYDTLSINIGCIPKPIDAIANTNADLASVTPVKPIDGFAARWNKILSRVLQLSEGKNMRIAIVGGGAGGVELSFSIHQRLKSELSKVGIDPSTVKMLLLNRGQSIMKSHGRYEILYFR